MAETKKPPNKRKTPIIDYDPFMDKGWKLKWFLTEFMGVLTLLSTVIVLVLGWLSLEYYFSLPSDEIVYSEPPDNYETINESHHEYNSDSVGELE